MTALAQMLMTMPGWSPATTRSKPRLSGATDRRQLRTELEHSKFIITHFSILHRGPVPVATLTRWPQFVGGAGAAARASYFIMRWMIFLAARVESVSRFTRSTEQRTLFLVRQLIRQLARPDRAGALRATRPTGIPLFHRMGPELSRKGSTSGVIPEAQRLIRTMSAWTSMRPMTVAITNSWEIS